MHKRLAPTKAHRYPTALCLSWGLYLRKVLPYFEASLYRVSAAYSFIQCEPASVSWKGSGLLVWKELFRVGMGNFYIQLGVLRRTCFLSFMTLNRSKSFNCLRLSNFARFWAHELDSHFFSIPSFSHWDFNVVRPAPRGSLERTMGVRERYESLATCRGTTDSAFDEGPSTST